MHVTWRCLNKQCKATVQSYNGEIINRTDHVPGCLPDPVGSEIRIRMANMKRCVRDTRTPLFQIYMEEMAPLTQMGPEFIRRVPTFQSVSRNFRRVRNEALGYNAREAATAERLELPPELLRLTDGTSFLLKDILDGNKRILIFASPKGKHMMRHCRKFFVDGTFKSCAKQFAQLYTLHADLHSDEDHINVFPVAFALLPDKSAETYRQLFRCLRDENGWMPISITVDFEASCYVALRNIFPDAEIKGCYFHFKQCLWRKVQELGLATLYQHDEDIHIHIGMCAALSLIPVNRIDDGWISIQETTPLLAQLRRFYDYFVDQWLDSTMFNREMWNVETEVHRTNNQLEGWNHKLNMRVGCVNPSFKKLIVVLKEEALYMDFLASKVEMGVLNHNRSHKYRTLQQRITRARDAFDETGDLVHFLRTLGHISR